MCGRFGSSFSGTELVERYELGETPEHVVKSYNVAPGYSLATITRNSPNKVILMKWGFIPEWADPKSLKLQPPINARDDKLFVSGFYKSAIAYTRCLIPFSWFYEWKKFTMDGKEQKLPYLIKVKEEEISSFAGIYSEKKDAEGKPVYTCAIITTKSNSLMSKIHNRMPVILDREDEDKWLEKETGLDMIKKLVKPYDADKMEAFRISSLVNNPKNDSAEVIKKIDEIKKI